MFLYLPVAKRKTLFDDRPVEISVSVHFFCSPSLISLAVFPYPIDELPFLVYTPFSEFDGGLINICLLFIYYQELTYIIKQDIASINKQIAGLQTYLKQRQAQGGKHAVNKQIDEHNTNVVMLLQSKLASTSMAFKDVLEVRTQNMKESKDRTEQFMSSTSAAASQTPSSMFIIHFS